MVLLYSLDSFFACDVEGKVDRVIMQVRSG